MNRDVILQECNRLAAHLAALREKLIHEAPRLELLQTLDSADDRIAKILDQVAGVYLRDRQH